MQGVDYVGFCLTGDDFFTYLDSRTYIVHFLAYPVTGGGNLDFLQRNGLCFHHDIDHTAVIGTILSFIPIAENFRFLAVAGMLFKV